MSCYPHMFHHYLTRDSLQRKREGDGEEGGGENPDRPMNVTWAKTERQAHTEKDRQRGRKIKAQGDKDDSRAHLPVQLKRIYNPKMLQCEWGDGRTQLEKGRKMRQRNEQGSREWTEREKGKSDWAFPLWEPLSKTIKAQKQAYKNLLLLPLSYVTLL